MRYTINYIVGGYSNFVSHLCYTKHKDINKAKIELDIVHRMGYIAQIIDIKPDNVQSAMFKSADNFPFIEARKKYYFEIQEKHLPKNNR